jgi:hypothetical protein
MSAPTYRLSIFSAAILLAAFAPRPLRAQDPLDLPTDFLWQKMHEWKLQHDQGRLQNDINQGDAISVNRDLDRIRRDERLLWWDRRRIRRDMWLPAGPWVSPSPRIPVGETLVAHPQYPGYGYYPSNPAQLYQLPQAAIDPSAGAAPDQVAVVIVNAGEPGPAIEYVVDGRTYKIESGQHQRLVVKPRSTILYDRGGELGGQRYTLSAGVYEFRSGTHGWALFKLKATARDDASGSRSDAVPKNELPIMSVAPEGGGEPGVDRAEPER